MSIVDCHGGRVAGEITAVHVCRVQPLEHSPYAGQEVAEYAGEALPAESLRQYAYAEYIDEPLVLIDRTAVGSLPAGQNELFYYHQNSLYCVAALTDQAGAPLERYSFSLYGLALYHNPNTGDVLADQPVTSVIGNSRLYIGRERDAESGLNYFRARFYSALLGRFIGRDPASYAAGDANLYCYVADNPLMYVDPTGKGITSLDTSIEECMKRATAVARAECLEGLLDLVKGCPPEQFAKLQKLASSMRSLADHLDKLRTAQHELGKLKEALRVAKGKTNQTNLEDAIDKLAQSIKGHIKEITQRWGEQALNE